jgi:hypothetical protein
MRSVTADEIRVILEKYKVVTIFTPIYNFTNGGPQFIPFSYKVGDLEPK